MQAAIRRLLKGRTALDGRPPQGDARPGRPDRRRAGRARSRIGDDHGRGGRVMRDFLRILALMWPQAGWMALSIALSAVATLAHVALMATSGWFITAMAAAGFAGVSMNYFTPAAMIRAFAIVRTGGRYVERLVGHEATLKFVASLRPWLFREAGTAGPGRARGRAQRRYHDPASRRYRPAGIRLPAHSPADRGGIDRGRHRHRPCRASRCGDRHTRSPC